MHWFRERPLTWLFWMATACISLAGFARAGHSAWFGMFLEGVLLVLSAWAAIGRAHRLARGAVLVCAPLPLAAVAHSYGRAADEAAWVLGVAMAYGLTAFATAGMAAWGLAIWSHQRPPAVRWRFSVIELMGWMIVVAIGSWAVSYARMPPWHTPLLSPLVLVDAVPPAAAMALFASWRRRDPASLGAAAVLLAAYAASSQGSAAMPDVRDLAVSYAYVAAWIVVVRLDEASRRAAAT